MKRTILAAAMLAAIAAPALAADNDLLAEAIAQRWQGTQQALQALLQERSIMRERLAAQEARIAELQTQCGDKCKPGGAGAPAAQSTPAPAPAAPAKP